MLTHSIPLPNPATLVLAGIAVLTWPLAPGRRRLRSLLADHRPRPARRRWRGGVLVVAGPAVAGCFLAGPAGAAAVAAVAATARWRWRARHDLRSSLAAVDGLADGLRAVVAGLASGGHPAAVAEAAAVDAQPTAATVLRRIAAAARLGGDVEQAVRVGDAHPPAVTTALDQVAAAWTLAARHGIPLAVVLDSVRRDLDQRVRFARQTVARMAGPRASAAILAGLPAVGLLLGESMGAEPLRVLTDSSAGQGLLLIGVLLACAGIAWSARITGRAVLR